MILVTLRRECVWNCWRVTATWMQPQDGIHAAKGMLMTRSFDSLPELAGWVNGIKDMLETILEDDVKITEKEEALSC